MKTYRFLGILVAAVILPLAGCDNVEDEVPDAGNDQKVVVKFTGGWGDGSARTLWNENDNGFTVTWKGKDENSSDYDKVGIYAYEPGETSGNKMKACYYPTTSGTSASLDCESVEKNELKLGETYDFYSYFPYDKDIPATGKKNIYSSFKTQLQSIPNNSDHLPALDLMFAKCEGVTMQDDNLTSVNFTYRHLLTCLQFQIKNEGSKSVKINQLLLKREGGGIIPNTFQVNRGEVEASTDTQLFLNIDTPEELAPNNTQNFWVMIYPAEANSEVFLSVYDEGTTGGSYASKYMNFPSTVAAGVNYVIKLKLSNNGIIGYDNQ